MRPPSYVEPDDRSGPSRRHVEWTRGATVRAVVRPGRGDTNLARFGPNAQSSGDGGTMKLLRMEFNSLAPPCRYRRAPWNAKPSRLFALIRVDSRFLPCFRRRQQRPPSPRPFTPLPLLKIRSPSPDPLPVKDSGPRAVPIVNPQPQRVSGANPPLRPWLEPLPPTPAQPTCRARGSNPPGGPPPRPPEC